MEGKRVKERNLDDIIASIDLTEFLPHRMIRIQPMSASLHYSHALFEGMSMVKAQGKLTLFHPWLNLERMRKSSREVGLDMQGFGDREIISNIFSLAALNGFDNGRCRIPVIRRAGRNINKYYIRPLLFVDSDGFGLSARSKTRLMVSVFQMGEYLRYDHAKGIEAMLYPHPRRLPFPSVKAAGNYQLGILARKRMEEFNARNGTQCLETVFCDDAGKLVEGCVENISFIRGRELVTPHPSSGALPGVTLRLVRSIAQKLGLSFRFGSFAPEELERADCVILSGNAVGVVPVSSLAVVDGAFNHVRTLEFDSASSGYFARIREEYERMETAQGEYASLHERMEDWVPHEERARLNSVGKRYIEKALDVRQPGGIAIHPRSPMPLQGGASMLRRFGLANAYPRGGDHDKGQGPGKFG